MWSFGENLALFFDFFVGMLIDPPPSVISIAAFRYLAETPCLKVAGCIFTLVSLLANCYSCYSMEDTPCFFVEL